MQGKVSPERSAATGVYVGIDVCKGWLDVYLHPIGQGFRVANDRIGLKRLKRELALHEVALVAVEATGKFHRLVQRHLHAAGLAVAVTNPLRSRLFCEAIGQLAKTDAIDARLLAIMAESLNPRATPPPPEIVEELQEIVRARAAAVEDRTALLNQKAAARVGLLKSELARRIAAIERCLVRLEKAIQAIIARDTMLARRFKILLSIPGIGPIAAVGMLAGLAEMGARSGKEIAMLSASCAGGLRQRRDERAAPHSGRALPCPHRHLLRRPLCVPLQSRPGPRLSAPHCRWQETQSGPHRRHAKARPARQYPRPPGPPVAAKSSLTQITDAEPVEGRWQGRRRYTFTFSSSTTRWTAGRESMRSLWAV